MSGDPSSVSCHTKTTETCSPSPSQCLCLYQCVNTLAGPCMRTRGRRPANRVPLLRSAKSGPAVFLERKRTHLAVPRSANPCPRAAPLRLTAGAPGGRAQTLGSGSAQPMTRELGASRDVPQESRWVVAKVRPRETRCASTHSLVSRSEIV